jgi:competence protein ComEA
MPFLTNLESRFGVTRGDITITLFLVTSTIVGFIYTTFFDERPVAIAQREMRQLVARHDSIESKKRETRLAELEQSVVKPDTVPSWQPLTGQDAVIEERVEKAKKPAGGSGKKELPAGPIDLNSASKEELMRLPGVGEKTALAIIERRKQIPFRRIEDIMEVKGIGAKKFETMKPFLTIR